MKNKFWFMENTTAFSERQINIHKMNILTNSSKYIMACFWEMN